MRLLLFLIPALALAYSGVDVSQLWYPSAFQCMAGQGNGFAIIRGFCQTGRPDGNSVHTVYNAWAGGMRYVDLYMYPCPVGCQSAAQQVIDMINYQRAYNTTYGMVWVDVEGAGDWGGVDYNRNFFNQIVNQLQAMGQVVGVYASKYQWTSIMGDWTGGSRFPLWYAHYDGNPSFSDWVPFGGWGRPAIKQWSGSTSYCGANVDRNWYPDGVAGHPVLGENAPRPAFPLEKPEFPIDAAAKAETKAEVKDAQP